MDKEFLQNTAKEIKARLPDGYAFILLAIPFSTGGDSRLVYVSNMDRQTAVLVLKEWLIKCSAEEDWMKHL